MKIVERDWEHFFCRKPAAFHEIPDDSNEFAPESESVVLLGEDVKTDGLLEDFDIFFRQFSLSSFVLECAQVDSIQECAERGLADVVESYGACLRLDASPLERFAEVFGVVAEEFFEDSEGLSRISDFDRDEGGRVELVTDSVR